MPEDINGNAVRIQHIVDWSPLCTIGDTRVGWRHPRFNSETKTLKVFTNHRSGSNMFAALLHNSPEVFALNSGSGTKRQARGWDYALKYPIYPLADLYKDENVVKYYLLDEIKPFKSNLLNNITVRIDHDFFGNRNIACFRNPFAVLASLYAFHQKYNRPEWIITEQLIAQEITIFRALVEFAKNKKVFPVFMDRFILNIDDYLFRICDFLGINYFSDMGDFVKTFESAKTRDGGRFVYGYSDIILGGFFHRNSIKLDKQEEVFVCDGSNKAALGFGGFNPRRNIDSERFLSWKQNLTSKQFDMMRSLSKEILSEEVTDLLCDIRVGATLNEAELFRLL